MDNIKSIGEQLVKEGVFGLQTPSGDINMTAVLRYLIHQELQHRKTQNNEEKQE